MQASAILPLPATKLEAFGPMLAFQASSGGSLVLLGNLGQMATLGVMMEMLLTCLGLAAKFAPGVYALSVQAVIPPHIEDILAEKKVAWYKRST